MGAYAMAEGTCPICGVPVRWFPGGAGADRQGHCSECFKLKLCDSLYEFFKTLQAEGVELPYPNQNGGK